MENLGDGIKKDTQIISCPRIKGGFTATTIEAFEKWVRDLPQDRFPVNVRISGAPESQLSSANDLANQHAIIQGQLGRAGYVDFYRPKK